MLRRFVWLLGLLAAGTVLASDADFNGRWDITVLGQSRPRAWWLEVEGAGTPQIRGRFVGFPGGDLNDIQKISIQNGELTFSYDREARASGNEPAIHQLYTARLAGNRLEGLFESGDQKWKWVGVRAPDIRDADDGSWRQGRPIELLHAKGLSGWHGVGAGGPAGWQVDNGVLKSTGGANNLETDGKYWNFLLHVEYRVGPHSNSGIGLRGRYEVQILEDRGRPLDRHSNGALYSRIVPAANVSKPAGEWQTYDIRLVGRHVTVISNGEKIIDNGLIEGLTAIADNADEAKPGPILLQGDHGPVEFRRLTLTPLNK